MTYREQAISFNVDNEQLFGVVATPDEPAESSDIGVVLIVGGPQYRAGSHRQFTLLSRAVAAAGFPVLRFDYRGMGDSSGAARTFESTAPDIAAALNALQSTCPGVRRVVLWGLCDAASAALMYWNESRDARVAGLCLLNPWVRSAETLARTHVKHYYGQRLREKEFWLKLLSGKVALAALGGFFGNLRLARSKTVSAAAAIPYQHRMASAWKDFPNEFMLIMSGDDYTAKEFLDTAAADPVWAGAFERPMQRCDVTEADHTFSSAAWRAQAEQYTLDYLNTMRQAKP